MVLLLILNGERRGEDLDGGLWGQQSRRCNSRRTGGVGMERRTVLGLFQERRSVSLRGIMRSSLLLHTWLDILSERNEVASQRNIMRSGRLLTCENANLDFCLG